MNNNNTTPLDLLQPLAHALPEAWLSAALARRRRELEQLVQEQRAAEGWQAETALQLAHLLLMAGLPGRGDDLVLEADQLMPEAGLIPDWWGLWPTPQAAAPEPAVAEAQALAASYVQLRHHPPEQAWQLWHTSVQANRQQLEQPALQLLLGLVINGRERLNEPLEPALSRVFGDELLEQEPALAWRWLNLLCERLPEWDYGRLKAADLNLQRGELERCRQQLEAANAAQQQLTWLHDITARLQLAEGNVAAALQSWQRAIELCQGDAELVELFRQRAREARRGPGVLQARSLLNAGQLAEAAALLDALLEQDPQWPPLRHLREQAQQQPQTPTAASAAPEASDAVQRLEQQLHRLAEQAQLPWPPAEPLPAERDAAGAEQFVEQALGRLALLG